MSADEERLDVHNGLLLSSLWDAAFDAGWVGFRESGDVMYGKGLGEAARGALGEIGEPLSLMRRHQRYLAWHREHVFRP